jgi:hypothetical protein
LLLGAGDVQILNNLSFDPNAHGKLAIFPLVCGRANADSRDNEIQEKGLDTCDGGGTTEQSSLCHTEAVTLSGATVELWVKSV